MEKDIYEVSKLFNISRLRAKKCISRTASVHKTDFETVLHALLTYTEPKKPKSPKKSVKKRTQEIGLRYFVRQLRRLQKKGASPETMRRVQRDAIDYASHPKAYDKEFLYRMYDKVSEFCPEDLHIVLSLALAENDAPVSEIIANLFSNPPTRVETMILGIIGGNIKEGVYKVSNKRKKLTEIFNVLLDVGTDMDKETAEDLL